MKNLFKPLTDKQLVETDQRIKMLAEDTKLEIEKTKKLLEQQDAVEHLNCLWGNTNISIH